MKRSGLWIGLVLVGAAALGRLALEPEASAAGRIRNPAWLPSGKLLRISSMGQRLVTSDLYWLRLVQYMGETVLSRSQRWEALLPLAEIVTDLDPRHGYAYQVAGSNLAGLAHRYDEADRILQKGMEAVPDRWQLPFTYAANKFLFQGDFAEAAAYARRAAEVGHRPHLALLAANLSLVADTPEEYAAAVQILEESIRQADPDLREQLVKRLVKVRTYEVISTVEKAVAAFEGRHGRRPSGVPELQASGLLGAFPQDPSGGLIVYDPGSGTVRSTVLGERRPIRRTESEGSR